MIKIFLLPLTRKLFIISGFQSPHFSSECATLLPVPSVDLQIGKPSLPSQLSLHDGYIAGFLPLTGPFSLRIYSPRHDLGAKFYAFQGTFFCLLYEGLGMHIVNPITINICGIGIGLKRPKLVSSLPSRPAACLAHHSKP